MHAHTHNNNNKNNNNNNNTQHTRAHTHIYLLTYLLTYWLTDWLAYLLTYLFTYLLTYLLTYLHTYLPTYFLSFFLYLFILCNVPIVCSTTTLPRVGRNFFNVIINSNLSEKNLSYFTNAVSRVNKLVVTFLCLNHIVCKELSCWIMTGWFSCVFKVVSQLSFSFFGSVCEIKCIFCILSHNLHTFNAKCFAEETGCVISMTFDEVVCNGMYHSSHLRDYCNLWKWNSVLCVLMTKGNFFSHLSSYIYQTLLRYPRSFL